MKLSKEAQAIFQQELKETAEYHNKSEQNYAEEVRRSRKADETITGQQLQLDAARYTFHKVVKHKYKEEPIVGTQHKRPADVGEIMYRKAMANYDGIIRDAVGGASHDANMKDMAKGFE